jgi:hypothetical protein
MSKKPVVTIPKRDSDDPRWAELDKYIQYMADALGVTTWYITLDHDDPKDPSSVISVYIAKQSVEATIRVSDRFWEKDALYQRWCVLHEILHIKHAPYWNAAEQISVVLAPATIDILNQLDERFIDEIALMLGPGYKLPPAGFEPTKAKPKGKRRAT